MADLLEGTTCNIEWVKKLGYNVKVLWECEFHQQLATNPEMKDFISSLKFDTPLEPRHGFFGGRTNAVCLYKEVFKDEKIHYGHLEILSSEDLVNCSPTEFFGMIKCEILPPLYLFHPLQPYRAQGKCFHDAEHVKKISWKPPAKAVMRNAC